MTSPARGADNVRQNSAGTLVCEACGAAGGLAVKATQWGGDVGRVFRVVCRDASGCNRRIARRGRKRAAP